MKEIIINEKKYNIIKDYKNALTGEDFDIKLTDYFDNYDYIFGDWAYGKLRLKGFYESTNKKANKINNIENLDEYIKEYCAYECKYFLIKKDVE